MTRQLEATPTLKWRSARSFFSELDRKDEKRERFIEESARVYLRLRHQVKIRRENRGP